MLGLWIGVLGFFVVDFLFLCFVEFGYNFYILVIVNKLEIFLFFLFLNYKDCYEFIFDCVLCNGLFFFVFCLFYL